METIKSRAEVMTIDDFRAKFPPKARPTRATVRRWAREGTREGVKLRALIFDGKYYFEKEAVAEFMRQSEKAPAVVDRGTRYAAACAQLRQLGLKF